MKITFGDPRGKHILDPSTNFTSRNEGKVNPLAGTAYEELWDNNPYADKYYDPTFWDKIGLSNKAKDANAEYDRLYSEYVSGLLDQHRQDEYNSPTAEAQRMREAGINPDLAGLSGQSNTNAVEAPNAGPIPALTGESPAHQVLGSITSVLGFATSTLSSIQSIKGLSLDNTAKSLGNFESFVNLAHPHIVNEYANRFAGGRPNDWSEVAGTSAMSLGLSRRDSKRYKDAFTSLLSSSKYTATEKAYSNLNANDLAMRHYIGKMTELAFLAQKHKYQGDISNEIYRKDYFDNLSGQTAAEGENRVNSNKGWLDKWRNDFYKTLYKDFNDGSMLAGLILIGQSNLLNAGSRAITGMARFLSDL